MLTDEQRAIRATGIGSSEIASLCGESPWANAHDVWQKKLGLVEDDAGEPAWWGSEMEPIIGRRYTRETGVELVHRGITSRHPELPFALASEDFMWLDMTRVVECKAVFRTAREWSLDEDGVPPQYIIQANWQCGVLGVKRFDVAVFVAAFATFRIYEFEFDEALFQHCVAIADRFWNGHVLTRLPPPVDHSDAARRSLSLFYTQRAPLKEAPPEAESLVLERLALKSELDAAKARFDLTGNRLREMVGEAEGMRGDWGCVTWRADKNGVRSLKLYPKKEKAAA